MKFWYTEKHTDTRGLSFEISQILQEESSPFQQMTIVETPDFGRMMLLDGVIMVTEKDEFVYHEMLTHVALYTHPHPQRVLIIGGGDGGILREVLRHPGVQKATLVEIDEMVIRGAKQFFPALAQAFDSPRAEVLVEDGIKYLQETKERFDVILVDSTDPVGPAVGLFAQNFYQSCYTALSDNGILVAQSESPYIPNLRPVIQKVQRDLRTLFPQVYLYLAAIQTYQAGLWSFSLASKEYHPILNFQEQRYQQDNLSFNYYNAAIHKACFALPSVVEQLTR